METQKPNLTIVPREEDVIRAEVKAIADTATPKDIARANEIAAPDKGLRREKFSAVVAAYLFMRHNRNNRPFRVAKYQAYLRKMKTGKWGYTHQGLAFDVDSFGIDLQHRMAAQAISGNTYEWPVDCGLPAASVTNMDDGAGRNAGDALKFLNQEKNGGLKATVQRIVTTYLAKAEDRRPEVMVSDTVEQVISNRALLDWMIDVSEKATKAVASPILSVRDSTVFGCLLAHGEYPRDHIEAIIAALQMGVSSSESSPLFLVAQIIAKANAKKATSGTLTMTDRLAMLITAAGYYAQGVSVTPGVFKRKAGSKLPLPIVPEDAKFAASVADAIGPVAAGATK
jgi:hypothetical protein